jgi:hypothetical protein
MDWRPSSVALSLPCGEHDDQRDGDWLSISQDLAGLSLADDPVRVLFAEPTGGALSRRGRADFRDETGVIAVTLCKGQARVPERHPLGPRLGERDESPEEPASAALTEPCRLNVPA